MANVRPYEPKDKENVREICLETGPKNAHEPKERVFLLACFCDYYVETEPKNCFVIADDDDNAVGYIFSAMDFTRWYNTFCKQYVPVARKASLSKGIMAWFTTIPVKYYAKRYPAHLHIDILPAYQRQGLGSKLMDACLANLSEKKVPAVMLVCGASNKQGINFYKKYGFTEVRKIFGFVVMGMELN